MASVSKLEADLVAARNAHSAWSEKAAPLLAELAQCRSALEARTVRDLNDQASAFAAEVSAASLTAVLGWADQAWAGYTGAAHSLLDFIRIGHLNETQAFAGEVGIQALPAQVPFLGLAGPLLVFCDEASQSTAREMIQSIVLRSAVAMPSEARFTLLDPIGLGSAFPMRGQLARVRATGRSVADELGEVLDDIRRINQDVIGHAERFASLSSQERAGEQFEIIAVMDFPDAYKSDPRAVDQITRVANSGPRAGRHLVVEVRVDKPLPRDFKLEQFKDAYAIDLRGDPRGWSFAPDRLPTGAEQKRLIESAAKSANHARAADWGDLVRPDKLFQQTSMRRVETPVGERVSLWLGDADDGQPSAHAMLAGQVGSGKSYLLHVFITGLASRYSPDELRLVLIDGKQGVEFEAYRNLPHADVVCLRTSPEMARSVLEDYAAEMEDRYERFQRANVVKLEDFRRATREQMPRMLLIVDEYQQLLEGDPERGARLLSRVLEKGRAAGTHLVLGSQTFNVQGLPTSALSHVHLRVSLSLAQDYLQGIQVFGAEGKKLIRELAPSGEVVINHESGRDGANKRSAVARLPKGDDGNALTAAVADIVSTASKIGGQNQKSPIVLSGRDGAVLQDNPFVTKWRQAPPAAEVLQDIARKPVRKGGLGIETWAQADRPLPLWLGRKFDVRGHALAILRRAPGNNLLMLGNNAVVRLGALANALAAIQAMVPSSSIEIDIVDGLMKGLPGEGLLRTGAGFLQKRSARVGVVSAADTAKVLADVMTDLASRSQASESQDAPQRLLVLSEPEYLTSLHAGQQSFGPAPKGPPADLREVIQRGPQLGIHVVLTASGLASVSSVLNPTRELKGFSHRVVQQMNEDDSMTLFASLLGARVAEQADHPAAMLQVDLMQGVRAGVLLKAYGANSDIFGSQDASKLEASLASALS